MWGAWSAPFGWNRVNSSSKIWGAICIFLQGRHGRQDRQDRGLAWILQNRTQCWQWRRARFLPPHCGRLACQKSAVGALFLFHYYCTNWFLGKYVLEGSATRRCVGGSWDGEDPICVGLSQHHDYSTEKPPTILFRHENGAIAQV